MRITKIRNRRVTKLVTERTVLINKIIRGVLGESFESEIPTDYEEVKLDRTILGYRFNTNSGNSYDLEFIFNYMLKEGIDDEVYENIPSYYKSEHGAVLTVDLAFVPSEINMDDRENQELYKRETNRDEVFELMGRLVYLVKEFIKNNLNINVFVIGKNTKEMKLSIYKKMYENIFSNDFMKTEGYNDNYPNEGSFYFIKKTLAQR